MPVRAASVARLARKTHEVVALGQRPEGWKETTVEKWMEEEMDQSFSTIKSYLKCARSPSDIAEAQGHRRDPNGHRQCSVLSHRISRGWQVLPAVPSVSSAPQWLPCSRLCQAAMPVSDPAKSYGDASCVSVSGEPSPHLQPSQLRPLLTWAIKVLRIFHLQCSECK